VTRSLALALVVLLALACGGERADLAWVAEVDGRRVTLDTLKEALGVAWDEASEEEKEALLVQELERLIGEQLVLNRADELGVEVGDEEVDAFIRRLGGAEDKPIDSELRQDVRKEMVMDRTAVVELAPRLQITESTLALHFADQRDRYATAARVQVRQVVVEDDVKARRLLGEIRGGEDFETLAREHSLGPESRQGGLLPPFSRGELPEAFDSAFDLEPGELSDVVESPYGYHIFRVERKIAAKEPTLDEMREKIRMELERERFISLREDWLRDLRRKGAIRVNDPLLESLQ
jgi:parvulin-like peptidyl-prolyl isomerase